MREIGPRAATVPEPDDDHALTHVFSAATAGQTNRAGWLVYGEWIDWVWSGEVSQVIAALEARQHEIGQPTATDGPTSPRNLVASSLTSLRNQPSRRNDPESRRQGLPITSSHLESTIKERNYRIKGTEKFWSEPGGEAVLPLKADTLCDSAPLTTFWQHRPQTRTGFHASAKQQSAKNSVC